MTVPQNNRYQQTPRSMVRAGISTYFPDDAKPYELLFAEDEGCLYIYVPKYGFQKIGCFDIQAALEEQRERLVPSSQPEPGSQPPEQPPPESYCAVMEDGTGRIDVDCKLTGYIMFGNINDATAFEFVICLTYNPTFGYWYGQYDVSSLMSGYIVPGCNNWQFYFYTDGRMRIVFGNNSSIVKNNFYSFGTRELWTYNFRYFSDELYRANFLSNCMVREKAFFDNGVFQDWSIDARIENTATGCDDYVSSEDYYNCDAIPEVHINEINFRCKILDQYGMPICNLVPVDATSPDGVKSFTGKLSTHLLFYPYWTYQHYCYDTNTSNTRFYETYSIYTQNIECVNNYLNELYARKQLSVEDYRFDLCNPIVLYWREDYGYWISKPFYRFSILSNRKQDIYVIVTGIFVMRRNLQVYIIPINWSIIPDNQSIKNDPFLPLDNSCDILDKQFIDDYITRLIRDYAYRYTDHFVVNNSNLVIDMNMYRRVGPEYPIGYYNHFGFIVDPCNLSTPDIPHDISHNIPHDLPDVIPFDFLPHDIDLYYSHHNIQPCEILLSVYITKEVDQEGIYTHSRGNVVMSWDSSTKEWVYSDYTQKAYNTQCNYYEIRAKGTYNNGVVDITIKITFDGRTIEQTFSKMLNEPFFIVWDFTYPDLFPSDCNTGNYFSVAGRITLSDQGKCIYIDPTSSNQGGSSGNNPCKSGCRDEMDEDEDYNTDPSRVCARMTDGTDRYDGDCAVMAKYNAWYIDGTRGEPYKRKLLWNPTARTWARDFAIQEIPCGSSSGGLIASSKRMIFSTSGVLRIRWKSDLVTTHTPQKTVGSGNTWRYYYFIEVPIGCLSGRNTSGLSARYMEVLVYNNV